MDGNDCDKEPYKSRAGISGAAFCDIMAELNRDEAVREICKNRHSDFQGGNVKQGICLFAVLIILHIFLSVHLYAADSDLYSKYIDNTETWVTDIVPGHSARLPGWADTLRSTPGGIIDIVTGQLVCAAGDIHIGMGGYGLEFSRFYSSGLAVNEIHGEVNDSYIGKIGTGWRTCLDYRLVRQQSPKKKGKARPSGLYFYPAGREQILFPAGHRAIKKKRRREHMPWPASHGKRMIRAAGSV